MGVSFGIITLYSWYQLSFYYKYCINSIGLLDSLFQILHSISSFFNSSFVVVSTTYAFHMVRYVDSSSIQASCICKLADCISCVFFYHKIVSRVIDFLYPITASQLLINTLLIYKSSSIFPFLMQVYLLCTFFFIYYPSKKNTQSVQFEIWMYFLVSILLPFSLYAVAGFSLLLVNPFQYVFHLLILVTFPTAVFLGLLSFRYFSWLSCR